MQIDACLEANKCTIGKTRIFIKSCSMDGRFEREVRHGLTMILQITENKVFRYFTHATNK